MDITTRELTPMDKERALWVEAGAMPHNRYLADVWDLFTKETDGALLGAFVGDDLAGIGKITRLYDGCGWLETLRVHPDWQRKGVGRAIWKQYFVEMEKMGLKSVGMYTEDYNQASKSLAESFGLTVKGFYSEWICPTASTPADSSFSLVSVDKSESALSKHYNSLPPYLVINRTFYPVAEGLGRHLADRGWLYQDQDGGLVIAGNRFHPQRLLHGPYFSETDRAYLFAQSLAAKQNAPAISRFVQSESELKESRFNRAESFMTLWIDL